jgi:phasin family protein
MKDMMANRSAEGMPQRQADMAKKSFEAAIANARELAEISSRANTEAMDLINKRFTESMEEMKSLAPKA